MSNRPTWQFLGPVRPGGTGAWSAPLGLRNREPILLRDLKRQVHVRASGIVGFLPFFAGVGFDVSVILSWRFLEAIEQSSLGLIAGA